MRGTRGFVGAALAALIPAAAWAAPVKIQAVEAPATWLAGTLEGVRLEDRGVLGLAPETVRVAALEEPFAYSVAALPDGWAVGTGPEGRVLAVDRRGQVTTLFDAEESDVFALWADPDGTLFAATSPHGKVYRIVHGQAEVWYEPGEAYCWALARGGDGALYLATGDQGRLHRIAGKGKGGVVFDSEEPHLRSLLATGDALVLGTAGEGRVLERKADGTLRTLYDSGLAEIVALARSADGTLFAAALASEASFVDLSAKPTEASTGAVETGTEAAPAEGGSEGPAAGSRPAGARGPRSQIVRLASGGPGEVVWQSQDETVFSLLGLGDRVWFGTGGEGRVYSWSAGRAVVERDFSERQVVGLLAEARGPVFLTTNEAAIHRVVDRLAAEGSYTSAVLDAGQAARYGVFRWRGETPSGTRVEVAFRAGDSAFPDATWSAWTTPRAGEEIAVPALDPARYFQFRLTLSGNGERSPRVEGTEVSYRQLNARPRIEKFGVLDPGQVLVPTSFNPADQVYEPASPNRAGIFTTLGPPTSRDDARLKTVWKRGMRTLRWKGSDPNQDELEATIEVRREGSEAWLPVVSAWRDEYYAFDASVLPDGRYRFRLTLSDRRGNPGDEALLATEESESVVLDQTPPTRSALGKRGARLTLPVADALSPVREAAISFDAGEWQPLATADGMLDGRVEELLLPPAPAGTRTVLVRVGDAAFNDATFDVSAEVLR